MINTFPPFDTKGVIEKCRNLVSRGISFTVKCVMNKDETIHHWEVEEFVGNRL